MISHTVHYGLTRGQLDCLRIVKELMDAAAGVAPSLSEIREEMDLRSRSGVCRYLDALRDRGYIRRLPHMARAIEILRDPPPFEEFEVELTTVGVKAAEAGPDSEWVTA